MEWRPWTHASACWQNMPPGQLAGIMLTPELSHARPTPSSPTPEPRPHPPHRPSSLDCGSDRQRERGDVSPPVDRPTPSLNRIPRPAPSIIPPKSRPSAPGRLFSLPSDKPLIRLPCRAASWPHLTWVQPCATPHGRHPDLPIMRPPPDADPSGIRTSRVRRGLFPPESV